jgi:hypothetical protein
VYSKQALSLGHDTIKVGIVTRQWKSFEDNESITSVTLVACPGEFEDRIQGARSI